jgi:hypothetical protein
VDSRNILRAILVNLADTLGNRAFLYEYYRVPPIELESRNDIPQARIALYEIVERIDIRTDAYRANLSQQRYGIDISYLRAYKMDKASKGELPLLDIRDSIVLWANTVDAGALTDCTLTSFGYDGNSGITRNDRFVTMTLVFTAIRSIQS